MLADKTIILGISGGIAAYKVHRPADTAQRYRQAGGY